MLSYTKLLDTGIIIEMICSPMKLDETEEMVLRPMNCPHHMMVYNNRPHSYRELPIRIAELEHAQI